MALIAEGQSWGTIEQDADTIAGVTADSHLRHPDSDMAFISGKLLGDLDTRGDQRALGGDIIHERIGHSALAGEGTDGHRNRGVMTDSIRETATPRDLLFLPNSGGKKDGRRVKEWIRQKVLAY